MNRYTLAAALTLWLAMALSPTVARSDPASMSATEIQEKLKVLQAIQARHEDRVLRLPGVVGIGVGLNEDETDLCFVVYAEKITARIRTELADGIESVPIRLIESGEIRAY